MDAHAWMNVVSWALGALGFLGLGPAMMSPMVFAIDNAACRRSTLVRINAVQAVQARARPQ